MISLIYGRGFHIFKPDVKSDSDEYHLKILVLHNDFFGPFPWSYQELVEGDKLDAVEFAMAVTLQSESQKPFMSITRTEIIDEDKVFLMRIMKLDPRDRPTVDELLKDEWFTSA